MMSLKDFCDYVKEHVITCLPDVYEDAQVDIKRVVKNNGLVLQGLTIAKQGSNVSPTLYLENEYEKYLDGHGLSQVLKEIADQYLVFDAQNKSFPGLTDNIKDYSWVKERLVTQVCNTWRNNDRFDEIPHMEREDLSYIYKVMVAEAPTGAATITVNNKMLEMWGVTVKELHKDAVENTNKISPAVVETMGQVLSSLTDDPNILGLGGFMEEIPVSEMMFIVSNPQRLGGAVHMFNTECLDSIAQKVGTDLIILPSSVHEVICISSSHGNLEEFTNMVREVNMSSVSPDEQLSDNVYYYDAKTKEIMLGSEHEKRMQENQQEKSNVVSMMESMDQEYGQRKAGGR